MEAYTRVKKERNDAEIQENEVSCGVTNTTQLLHTAAGSPVICLDQAACSAAGV
jgi:hypothetical protein